MNEDRAKANETCCEVATDDAWRTAPDSLAGGNAAQRAEDARTPQGAPFPSQPSLAAPDSHDYDAGAAPEVRVSPGPIIDGRQSFGLSFAPDSHEARQPWSQSGAKLKLTPYVPLDDEPRDPRCEEDDDAPTSRTAPHTAGLVERLARVLELTTDANHEGWRQPARAVLKALADDPGLRRSMAQALVLHRTTTPWALLTQSERDHFLDCARAIQTLVFDVVDSAAESTGAL